MDSLLVTPGLDVSPIQGLLKTLGIDVTTLLIGIAAIGFLSALVKNRLGQAVGVSINGPYQLLVVSVLTGLYTWLAVPGPVSTRIAVGVLLWIFSIGGYEYTRKG